MIGEWEIGFTLTTPEGTLDFNDTDGGNGRRYQLVPDRCSAGLPVRLTEDDMPQHDGKIPHRRWRSGYSCHLAVEPLVEGADGLDCAGGADLVAMLDELGLHLNSMIRTGLVPGFPNARLAWTPTGAADCRMFDRAQLMAAPSATLDGAMGGVLVEFDIDTPYPYYIACTEDDTVLSGTGTVVTNLGNTDYYPVIQVDGATSAFTITNESVLDEDGNPLEIAYDDTLPGAVAIGGGDYLEIITFQGTAFLNGSGGSRLAGIDLRTTDFFPLVPGDNVIGISGATATILSNNAWA